MPKRANSRREPRPAAHAAQVERRPWAAWFAALCLSLLGLVPMANLVTTGAGLPWWGDAARQWTVWTGAITALTLLASHFFGPRIEAVISRVVHVILQPSQRVFAALIAATTCALALSFGWRLFQWQAVVGDEFAQNWQAHLIAQGRLFAAAEPHGEFFSTAETLVADGRWSSQFPMGWPVIRALGELSRAPWLINPLLAGIAAVALYRFLATTRDELTARGAAMLFALSPFVLFMAGSQMNHMATLTCLWIAVAALSQWESASSAAQSFRAAAVIGLCCGVAGAIRPYDATLVAIAIGLFQLRCVASRRWLVRSLVVQCAIAAIPVALLLVANRVTTGHALPFGYDVLNGPEHRPGFHMTPLGFEHTPLRGLYIISAYLMKLDVALLAWPVPALLPVVVTLVLQRHSNRWDSLLLGILALFAAGYAVYWSESYFMGPRFLFVAAPVFLWFTARMPGAIRERVQRPAVRTGAALLIPIWLLAAWLVPASSSRAFGVQQLARTATMHVASAAAVATAVRRHGDARALIFIPEGMHARLAARLRALGTRPLFAEQVALTFDACTVHASLDAAERDAATVPLERRIQAMVATIERDAPAAPLIGRSPVDRLSLVAGRPVGSACADELSRTNPDMVSVAEMLPYADVDAHGRLGGGIVYARNFGQYNEVLRSRFGDMPWYVARISRERDSVSVTLEPYR